jgi:hypothetical protein
MYYKSTTYFAGHKTHIHENQYQSWECSESHKKPKPLSHEFMPYIIAYALGILTTLVIN